MIRAVTYALNPTPAQEALLRSHCGAARFAYNALLARVKAIMDQREAERSYGVGEDDLTPSISWTAYSLRREFNSLKPDVAPWWGEVSKEAFASGAANLASALSNWNASRKGVRAGRPVGFPTFKARATARASFTYTTGAFRLGGDRRSVILPRIGAVATYENTAAVHRRILKGTARISKMTVSFDRGRWKVSCLVHIATGHAPQTTTHPNAGSVVGVDVGCHDWIVAATDDGAEVMRVPVPASITAAMRSQRLRQRRGKRMEHGNRKEDRIKSKRAARNEAQVARAYARAANIREHVLHTATTAMTRQFETVVLEDLNVAGMMTRGGAYKRGLNRAIARSSFATTRTMTQYKAQREGGVAILVDRFYPSSKTCSGCGAAKATLSLSERTYSCERCRLVIDRDLNAAINLARKGTAGSGPVAGRGAGDKPASLRASGDPGYETSRAAQPSVLTER